MSDAASRALSGPESFTRFMLDCFYLWVDERATVFCPICATDSDMGEDCLCGEVAA